MIIPSLMGQLMLLTSMVIFGFMLHRLLRLDMNLACLASGALGGWVISLSGIDSGIRFDNIHDLVFYFILPILIFESAWHIKPNNLKKWLSSVLLLSTVGLLISCVVVAGIVYLLMNSPTGFPWIAALLTGAILAATDPVSVVASLKKEQAPEALTTLVESESLFNDATAIILFSTILYFAVSAKINFEVTHFFYIFMGGLLLGSVLGLLAAILTLLLRIPATANIVLIFAAFASFYLGEHFFHVSGVLAVVAAALVSRMLLKEQTHELLKEVVPTLDWMGLYLTALVFVLMGLTITFEMFSEMWLAILIAIPAALVGRAVAVMGVCAVSSKIFRPVSFGWQLILVWGGLRGVIAIVLVLGLPITLPYWYTVQSMVFGVVLFSVIIQGLTTPFLIRNFAHRGNDVY